MKPVMYNVIWVIDYIGDSCFEATISPSSDFVEDFSNYSIIDVDLIKLRSTIEELTQKTIDYFDHYGKIMEYLNIQYEFTEEAMSYYERHYERQANTASCLGCLFRVALIWFIIHYGIILVKWIILNVWPIIKTTIILMTLKLHS